MSFWPALGAGSWLRTNLLSHQTACQASLCTERHARHGLRGGPSQFPPGDSVNTLVGTPCPGGHPPWVDQDAADSGRGWQRVRGGGKEGAGCPGRTASSKAHSGGAWDARNSAEGLAARRRFWVLEPSACGRALPHLRASRPRPWGPPSHPGRECGLPPPADRGLGLAPGPPHAHTHRAEGSPFFSGAGPGPALAPGPGHQLLQTLAAA